MLALLIPGVGMGAGTGSAPLFSGTIPDISKTENTGTFQYDLSTYFVGATSYSIAPAVETGWSFDTGTAVLEIDTDDVGSFGPFTVTATNAVGTADSNAFGVAVTAASTQSTGGWAFLNHYELELQRRRRRERKRRELEEETEQIQSELDRAIAQELRKQERLDDKRKDFERLAKLAKANADLEAARQYSERVATAYARALGKETYSALEALDRELRRAKEEDEFLATATMMLIH